MRRGRMVLVMLAMLVAGRGFAGDNGLDLLPLGDSARALEIASAPVGAFVDTSAGQTVNLERLAERAARARVLLLGEEHTSLDQKRVLAAILERMAAAGDDLVLGMEFFLRSDDEALARWGRGELDDDGLIRATHWYDRGSYRWEYYRDVMGVARRHGIPVVGLNVERAIPRAVNRGGIEALSPEQRREVGPVEVAGSPEHRYLISRYFGDTVAMMPPDWLDNMYAAQCLWDVVMARSILAALPASGTMVVVVGSGHVAYGLGIARRLAEERRRRGEPPLEVATFCPVTAPAPDPEGQPHGHPRSGQGGESEEGPAALFVRSLADFVGVFADSGGIEAYPRLGLKLTEGEGTPVVAMAWPDTIAEEAGFAPGDRLLDVNGRPTPTASEARLAFARLEWGGRLDVRVARGEEVLNLVVLLYPRVRSVEESLAPGWSATAIGRLDPTSASPVAAPAEAAAPRGDGTILLAHDGAAQRVEVWSEGRLREAHELDPEGRVARSLYLEPRADGLVEVVYERDREGRVTDTVRHDRSGRVL